MGFISTGNTFELTAYLTQKGRELLLNGTESDITAKYFVLGDSDTNYNSFWWLEQGFVPDLTGDNTDCVVSLAQNIGIKHSVTWKDGITLTPTPQPPRIKNEVRFLRPDNGKYYATLDCLIHLDRIARYQLFHAYSNASNVNKLKVQNNLLSPIADLYSKVKILNKPTDSPVDADFLIDDEMVFEMLFDANIFKTLNNTYIETTATNTYNNVTRGIKSPLIMTFSSTETGLKGSGRASVGILGREMGYIYKTEGTNVYEFLNSSLVENVKDYVFYTDENNTLLNKFTDFTLAARVTAKDKVTGAFKDFIYRGDKNLLNINDTSLQPLTNEKKYANQYAKLFADPTPVIDGSISTDATGIMTREIDNLKDFVQTSGIFSNVDGTNEYRTNKLSFNVYPKGTSDTTPATLNLIFKFDEDEILEGDSSFQNISAEGNTQFIQYEFVATNGVFYSQAKTATARRNNCLANQIGTEYTYVVAAGRFSGNTQAVANQVAQDFATANVQTEANKDGNGVCNLSVEYLSDPLYGYFSKTGCDYMSEPILINYPQGQYKSNESKIVANNLAQIAAQEEANNRGVCIPRPEVSISFEYIESLASNSNADASVYVGVNGLLRVQAWTTTPLTTFNANVGDTVTVVFDPNTIFTTSIVSKLQVLNDGVTKYINNEYGYKVSLGSYSFRVEAGDTYSIKAALTVSNF